MSERTRYTPAARCRACGAVTWVLNLAQGPRRVENPDHAEGCTKPPGRLDLQARMPMARRRQRFGEVLERPISDARLAAVSEELKS